MPPAGSERLFVAMVTDDHKCIYLSVVRLTSYMKQRISSQKIMESNTAECIGFMASWR